VDVVTTDGQRASLTLVLGGTRSGKSEVAEQLIRGLAGPEMPVTYVATGAGPRDLADATWSARIEAHRRRRPAAWSTIELGQGGLLGASVRDLDQPVLIDSLGTWLSGCAGFACGPEELCADLKARSRLDHGHTVVVSEEVGLGVHPVTEVGNAFADALGGLNRSVAAGADRVILVVAGRMLELPALGDV
jgi:adenosyl cobinamide kinase/adenosyl cobinamide phosphate guanylyltransferase